MSSDIESLAVHQADANPLVARSSHWNVRGWIVGAGLAPAGHGIKDRFLR
jgi:hypothetical protein